jgi:hypothetical protein
MWSNSFDESFPSKLFVELSANRLSNALQGGCMNRPFRVGLFVVLQFVPIFVVFSFVVIGHIVALFIYILFDTLL